MIPVAIAEPDDFDTEDAAEILEHVYERDFTDVRCVGYSQFMFHFDVSFHSERREEHVEGSFALEVALGSGNMWLHDYSGDDTVTLWRKKSPY